VYLYDLDSSPNVTIEPPGNPASPGITYAWKKNIRVNPNVAKDVQFLVSNTADGGSVANYRIFVSLRVPAGINNS